jgi:uncharacterized RDD family membrane protein YckC
MLQTKYASFFKRFIALVADKLILNILLLPLIIFAVSGFGISLLSNPWAFMDTDFDEWPLFFEALLSSFPIVLIIGYIAGYILLSWLYFALFESSRRQATLGKMMMGIFVADEYGRRISFRKALGRTLGKILSKWFCYLGFIIAIFTERSQALHDLLASTLVLEPDRRVLPPQVAALPEGPAPRPGPAVTAPARYDTPAQGGSAPATPEA